jgi:hypothetical protein
VSDSYVPIASVARSGRPSLETTVSHLRESAQGALDASAELDPLVQRGGGSRIACTSTLPSSSRGMNSVPSRVAPSASDQRATTPEP